MNLDSRVRSTLASAVTDVLERAVEGSTAGLRGSLARGVADVYSDIDAFWEVPDARFGDAVDEIPVLLSSVGPIESVRSDPALQNSEKRRLVFVQFEKAPLYWRVDIEVFAASIHRDASYDLENPDARGDDWSLTHSALMNGVAALKYLLRGREQDARESLGRAFDRIDLPVPDAPPWDQIPLLAETVGRIDLDQAELVRRLQLHYRDALAARGAPPAREV